MNGFIFIFLNFVNFVFNNEELFKNSELDNEIYPYPHGKHHDPKRTLRHVRDCIRNIDGEETYDTIKTFAPKNEYELNYIRYKPLDMYYKDRYKNQYGHHAIIKNPSHMISVLEPDRKYSCKSNTLATVLKSSKQKKCNIAINAGFFDPNKGPDFGKCLGNIISDGRYVQDSNGTQNANFGIRKDGSIVIGYISQKDVLSKENPFIQLISGVGWVLRNGELYLKESVKAECADTQTTSTLQNFFDAQSARTLIGVDKNGYVHIVQFDGKTWQSGVNLTSAGTYMKSIGIVNAINFDGGGSATFVKDGIVINYPTDSCKPDLHDGRICDKNVSTIICVHGDLSDKDDDIKKEVYEDLLQGCNRNYVLIIVLTVIIGICLVGNVFLLHATLIYREQILRLTSSSQQKEALRSLLERNSPHYLSGDSDDDEL